MSLVAALNIYHHRTCKDTGNGKNAPQQLGNNNISGRTALDPQNDTQHILYLFGVNSTYLQQCLLPFLLLTLKYLNRENMLLLSSYRSVRRETTIVESVVLRRSLFKVDVYQ